MSFGFFTSENGISAFVHRDAPLDFLKGASHHHRCSHKKRTVSQRTDKMKIGFLLASIGLIFAVCLLFYHYSFVRSGLASPLAPFYPLLRSLLVPLIGLDWYFLASAHPRKVCFYLLFSALGDACMAATDLWAAGAVGVAWFFLAHLAMSLHFHVRWRRVPCYSFVLMLPIVWIPGRLLVPQFGSGNFRAVAHAVYAASVEIGACSAVARVQGRGFCNLAFLTGYCGYFLLLLADIGLIWGEFDRLLYRQIQPVVVGTYVAAQIAILLSVTIDAQEKHGKGKRKGE
jgi:hypothetical protein